MKILFLQDNGINESLAMTEIAGLLKSHGHECGLLLEKNEKHFDSKIRSFGAGVIVIPMDVWGDRTALAVASRARQASDAPIVFCGTFPLLFPEIIEHSQVDIVVQGEAEFPMLEIVESLEGGGGLENIQNLVVKKDGVITRNEMRPLIQDLDELPLPDREIYYKYGFMRRMSMKRFASGRGCPNACSFCYNAKFRELFKGRGKYVRRKNVPRVMEEIDSVRSMSCLRSVHFSDDLFTYNSGWVLEFCEAYGKKFGRIPFTCNTTVHDVNEELIKEMKKAGCAGIAIGVETGSQELRMKRLNKMYTDEEIIATSFAIKKHGLSLTAFNMLALPYETIENAFETVRLNRKIRADNVRVTYLSPIPRTQLVENAVRDGLLRLEYEETGARIMTAEIETGADREFRTLYALFDIAVASPLLERIVRGMLRFHVPGFVLFLLLLPRMLREKRFFNISLVSGLFFYLNTAMPQHRTKNFNNYLP